MYPSASAHELCALTRWGSFANFHRGSTANCLEQELNKYHIILVIGRWTKYRQVKHSLSKALLLCVAIGVSCPRGRMKKIMLFRAALWKHMKLLPKVGALSQHHTSPAVTQRYRWRFALNNEGRMQKTCSWNKTRRKKAARARRPAIF